MHNVFVCCEQQLLNVFHLKATVSRVITVSTSDFCVFSSIWPQQTSRPSCALGLKWLLLWGTCIACWVALEMLILSLLNILNLSLIWPSSLLSLRAVNLKLKCKIQQNWCMNDEKETNPDLTPFTSRGFYTSSMNWRHLVLKPFKSFRYKEPKVLELDLPSSGCFCWMYGCIIRRVLLCMSLQCADSVAAAPTSRAETHSGLHLMWEQPVPIRQPPWHLFHFLLWLFNFCLADVNIMTLTSL